MMTKIEQSLRELIVMEENRLTQKFVNEGVVCEDCLRRMWFLYARMN